MKVLRNRILSIVLVLLFFSSLLVIPVPALVWNPGVTFSCDNEYYSTTTPLTVDNVSVDTHWVSVNGIGFNSTETANSFINFSDIKSYPKSSTGYILNWTGQKYMVVLNTRINGLKPSYDYILYTNATTSPKTSTSNGSIWVNQTVTTCDYKIYDPGIPTGWFVSLPTNVPAGSDTTGTGSIAAPFATLRKAINASTTSDTIYIRGGDYTQMGWDSYGTIKINRSGTTIHPFTISNYAGEKVVIDGKLKAITLGYGMIRLYSGTSCWNNITFYGINFSNCSADCIYGAGFAGGTTVDNITVSYCQFFNITKRAIYLLNSNYPTHWINNININNCTFKYIQNNATTGECVSFIGCKDYVFENCSARQFVKQFINAGGAYGYIRYNNFDNKYYFTIKFDPNTNGDRSAHHIYIYNNLFFGSTTATTLVAVYFNPEVANCYIHNISVYNNIFNLSATAAKTSYGVRILSSGSPTRMENIYIKHNTFYVSSGTSSRLFKPTKASTTLKNIFFANNICVNNGTSTNQIEFTDMAVSQTNVTLANNMYYKGNGATLGGWYTDDAHYTEASSSNDDPEPNNYATGDMHLNATSPAINTASIIYATPYDYEGTARPQAGAYDIGAYEALGGGIIPAAPTATTPGPTSNAVDRSSPIPALNITIEDLNADSMNLYFRSNHTGPWATLSSNLAVFNGTYQSLLPGFVFPGKKWWSVNVTDGAYWTNKTFNFTFIVVTPPTSGITLSHVRANWTTSTTVNITWTKGANCTNTYVYRSGTGYTIGTVLLYSGTNNYFNNTLLDPTVRYYYTLRPYNSVSLLYGNYHNVSLAETTNTSTTTSSSALFKGWLGTDKNMWTYYRYASSPIFDSTTTNITSLTEHYNGTAPYDYLAVVTTAGAGKQAGQTFKTGTMGGYSRYYLHTVSLRMYRVGAPISIVCSLWNANATGLPTVNLNSGSIVGTELTTDTAGDWVNITMPNYYLLPNTTYAVVVYAIGGSANYAVLLGDSSPIAYTVGSFIRNDGAGFYAVAGEDACFRIYGNRPYIAAGGLLTSSTILSTTTPFSISQTGIQPGQMYWYRTEGNDSKSNMTKGNIRYTLTNPDIPIFVNLIPYFTNNSVHIYWIKGNGANNTVIAMNNISYPSSVSSGVIYLNGTGTNGWIHGITFNATHYFSLFSFTSWGSLSRFSSGVHIPWGGVTFIVYNESKPWQVINASMIVTDSEGLHPVQFNNIYGYYSFNISQIPYGENTLFYISNVSYDSRLYPITIIPNIFYNFSFYLPPLHPPGWNTTTGNASAYYKIQIRDQKDLPVPNAVVQIHRYLNTTANYTYIGGFVTDGNGEGSISLFPFQLYMIKTNCIGYIEEINFWAPTIIDQGTTKIFKIYTLTEHPETREYTEEITFNGYIDRTALVIHVNYTDALSDTINAQIIVYELDFHTNLTSVFGLNITIGDSDIYPDFPGADNRNTYTVILHHNHSVFGYHTQSFIIGPRIVKITTPGYTNRLWDYNYGTNPLGWSNCLMWIIMVICLFYGGREELPLVFIAIGVIFEFINIGIGFFTWTHVAAGAFIPIMFIISGILVGWFRYRG